jgi:PHD/YefM family antitoxin component YafN of YafNO toxin-antitoxin module
MKYMTVSEARREIPALSESTSSTVLLRNSQPVAVLVPIREYRAMRALISLAADPAAAARVQAAHQRVQGGDLDGFEELDLGSDEEPGRGRALRQGSL